MNPTPDMSDTPAPNPMISPANETRNVSRRASSIHFSARRMSLARRSSSIANKPTRASYNKPTRASSQSHSGSIRNKPRRASSIAVQGGGLEIAKLTASVRRSIMRTTTVETNPSPPPLADLGYEELLATIEDQKQLLAMAEFEVPQLELRLRAAKDLKVEADSNASDAQKSVEVIQAKADAMEKSSKEAELTNFDKIQLQVKGGKVARQLDEAQQKETQANNALQKADAELRLAQSVLEKGKAEVIFYQSSKTETMERFEVFKMNAITTALAEAARMAMKAWSAALLAEEEAGNFSRYGMHQLRDSGRTTLLPQNEPLAADLELHIDGPVEGKARMTEEGEVCFAEKLWNKSSKKNMLPFQHNEIHNDAELGDFVEQLKLQEAAGQMEEDDGFDPSTVQRFLSLEKLQPPHEGLDDSVNRKHLEMYLSHKEFKNCFVMTKREFQSLPKWKQVSLKWEHNLYE